jgi:hypothetical protein
MWFVSTALDAASRIGSDLGSVLKSLYRISKNFFHAIYNEDIRVFQIWISMDLIYFSHFCILVTLQSLSVRQYPNPESRFLLLLLYDNL